MYKGRCRVFSTPTVRSLLRKFAVFLAGIGLLLFVSLTPYQTNYTYQKGENEYKQSQLNKESKPTKKIINKSIHIITS